MQEQKIRCMRCRGKKKIYKTMGGYSHANTGGVLVDCPLCLGVGRIQKMEDALKSIQETKNEKIPAKRKNKKTKEGT